MLRVNIKTGGIIVKIERLDPLRHRRNEFSCGNAELDHFLKQQANQYFQKGIGVTWVATPENDPFCIDGYYTIAMNVLQSKELESKRIRIPNIPVVLLGRLAVDLHAQGKGVGADLLGHALHSSVLLSQVIGAHAVVIDPIDAKATSFYHHFGFAPLPGAPHRLYIPISQLQRVTFPKTDRNQIVDLLSFSWNTANDSPYVSSDAEGS